MERADEPVMAPCQRCSKSFDWREDDCPNCGWNRREWTDAGRYGQMTEARP